MFRLPVRSPSSSPPNGMVPFGTPLPPKKYYLNAHIAYIFIYIYVSFPLIYDNSVSVHYSHVILLYLWVQQHREYRAWQKNIKNKTRANKKKQNRKPKPKPRKKQKNTIKTKKNWGKCRFWFCCLLFSCSFCFFWWFFLSVCFFGDSVFVFFLLFFFQCSYVFAKINFLCSTRGHNTLYYICILPIACLYATYIPLIAYLLYTTI